MSIVTKTGDNGMTSLYCGRRVSKDHVRVEICGAIDEVSSFLGLAKNITKDINTKKIINFIQKKLIILASEIAMTPGAKSKLKKRIDKQSVRVLEKEISCLENKYAVRVKSFCLPGENMASGTLDIARAITRRAERRCVTMLKKSMVRNSNIITYLNRLSDLLYLLARFNEKKK